MRQPLPRVMTQMTIRERSLTARSAYKHYLPGCSLITLWPHRSSTQPRSVLISRKLNGTCRYTPVFQELKQHRHQVPNEPVKPLLGILYAFHRVNLSYRTHEQVVGIIPVECMERKMKPVDVFVKGGLVLCLKPEVH